MNLRISLLIWMIVGFIGLSLTAESSLADVADEKKDKHGELQPVVRTLSTTEKNSRESEPDYEDEDEEEEDGEPEGREHVDEYEEELRSMAESHEAMSRDERRNSSDSIVNPPETGFSPGMVSSRNFDSQEKNLEESSDESMTSNEAISGEVTGPAQELLKFKRQASGKIKRVPTVKKELSSQIRFQGNDTNEDAVKGELLGKKVPATRQIIDNHLLDDDGINPVPGESYLERRSLDVEKERAPEDSEEYMDLDAPTEILGKLDKRQQSDLKGLETYLEPATHTYELEKLAKLEELRAEEYILAENLMELLVKLAENPKRWERTHKLLRDMENDLDLWRASDSNKRGYDFRALSQPDFPIPITEKLKPPTEKPKKKKKKKKKPRSQFSTSTQQPPSTTSSPITPSTTPAPTEATHWRIFPELFGSPVRNSLHKEPSNLAKIHYAVGKYQKPSVGSSNRNSDTEDTSTGYLNDQVPGILDPLSRKFHFGKINTHEKDSPNLNQHEQPSIYDPERDRAMVDYPLAGRGYQEPPRTRVGDRFDRYRPSYVGERVRNQIFKDYQEPASYPGEFPRQAPYAKAWKYSKYDLSPPVDPYYEDERSNWATRYRAWQTFWRPIFEIEDADEAKRRMLFGKFSPSSSSLQGSLSGGKSDKAMQIPWRSIDDSRSKSYSREQLPVADKTRNHSEFNEALSVKSSKQIKDENVALPKITMKTWNSLTSDPATWPFKLSDAKPWPKDKNGKSYNPNADLVRKLGLDKQERLLEKEDKKLNKGVKDDDLNLNLNGNGKVKNPWTSDTRKMWPIKMSPKIQSVGAWVMPADDNGWSSFNQQHFEDSEWHKGKPSGMTKWNVEFAKPVQDIQPKWKQFSYHKINTQPGKSGTAEESRRNAFIAVSAVSPSKYLGNEWRKNDVEENFGDNPIRTNGDIDRDDPSTQLLHNRWQTQVARPTDRRNLTDPLEYQLEELRLNNIEKRSAPTQATYMSNTLNSTATATASTTRADLEKSTKVAPKIEKFPSKPIKE
ncbi:GSCOCG00006641001-RA-CDS [Cotesia congregata]|nr:GSCOCG00006641001-RA-CDS [Cotesia congregata]